MTLAQRVATRFLVRVACRRVLYAFGINDLGKLSKMGRRFGVISAYRSELSKSQNQERHGQLVADLQKLGYRNSHPFKSQWEDMATKVVHKEKSLFIPNIDFDSLIELGKKYNQDAVLYKDPSGTIGVYFKDGTATMAFDATGSMGITKSLNPKEDYSKGRGLSFGLMLVDDRKFHYSGRPVLPKDIEKSLEERPMAA